MTQPTPPQHPALTHEETLASAQVGTMWRLHESELTFTENQGVPHYLIIELFENRIFCARFIPDYTDLGTSPLKDLKRRVPGHFSYTFFTPIPASSYRQATPDEYAEMLPQFISHAQADLAEAETVAQQKRDHLALVESFGNQIIERWCVKHGSFVAWRESALACLELLETRITFPSPDMDGLYAAHSKIQRIKEDGCFARGSWKIFREKP